MYMVDVSTRRRRVYLVDDGAAWKGLQTGPLSAEDLVLVFDFGLWKDLLAQGADAWLVDHIVSPDIMQDNNYRIYEFFRRWHLDETGKDFFSHRDIPIGFAFRQEIWGEFTFYLRLRLCLGVLTIVPHDDLMVSTRQPMVHGILRIMGVPFREISPAPGDVMSTFCFPVFQWMDEQLRPVSWRSRLRDRLFDLISGLQRMFDFISDLKPSLPRVFVQTYHPTRRIIERLVKDRRVRVVLVAPSNFRDARSWLQESTIPIRGSVRRFEVVAREMLARFRAAPHRRMIFSNGDDATEGVLDLILAKFERRLAHFLRVMDSVVRALDRRPLRLEILIANIGTVATMVDCYCRARGVPSFLIINGILGTGFLDEGKYATVINGYSESIRRNYFQGMDNVLALGDPRMDDYAIRRKSGRNRAVNLSLPLVTVGTSGYSPIDLNSYVAVEFDFMFDVLSALRDARFAGGAPRIRIKLRPNGYREQYARFIERFFPEVPIELVNKVPMVNVLEDTDLYISIYSQTLFEASMMGIPTIYYRKDTEVIDEPFNGKSELVTVDNREALGQALRDFGTGHPRFEAFLRPDVMSKYIGPLDGGNTERNLQFIYRALDASMHGRVREAIQEAKRDESP